MDLEKAVRLVCKTTARSLFSMASRNAIVEAVIRKMMGSGYRWVNKADALAEMSCGAERRARLRPGKSIDMGDNLIEIKHRL